MKEKVNEKIKDLQIKLGKFLKVGNFFFACRKMSSD